jgi:hypothetical protein
MIDSGKMVTLAMIAVLIGLVAIVYNDVGNDPELANKPEWSALQSVQAKSINEPSDGPVFVNVGSYNVVGVKSRDDGTVTWLLASPLVSPFLKIMPKENKVRISKFDFEKIKATVKLNKETEVFLRNSVE